MSHLGLGAAFDVLTAFAPADIQVAGVTGHRVHMKNYGGLALVAFFGAGVAAQAPVIVVQEHDAATAGTSQDLDVVTEYFKKEEAALDGDETWTKVTQTAGDITDADWDDANQVLVVAQIRAAQLSTGFEWLSFNVADPGAGASGQLAAGLYIGYDMAVQRAPENLAQPNA